MAPFKYFFPLFLSNIVSSSSFSSESERDDQNLTFQYNLTTAMISDNKRTREELSNFIHTKLYCPSPPSTCEGQHIRSRHADGCIDSGCCKYFSNAVTTQKDSENFCPNRPWLRWYFVDQYLVSDNPQLKIVAAPWEKSSLFTKTAVCMDCWNFIPECEIRTTVCWGPIQQQWRIQIFPGQIDNTEKRVYFSIMSEGLNKDNCVHIIDTNSTVGFNNSMGPRTMCEEPGICLQLSKYKCVGNYWESFYLEQVTWEDYLEFMKAKSLQLRTLNPTPMVLTQGGGGHDPILWVEIALGCLVLIGLGLALIFLWHKLTSAQKTLQSFYLLTNEEVDEFLYGNPHKLQTSCGNAHDNAVYMSFDKTYEINEEDLIVDKDKVLGKGQFGLINPGLLRGQPVAVKTTHPHVDVSYFKALLVEIKVMSYVGKQDNIVEFLGCVTNKIEERHIYLVLELSHLGDLQSYLIRQRDTFVMARTDCPLVKTNSYVTVTPATALSQKDLIFFTLQIVSALEFLATKQVIHGDVACRNILVFDKNVVKITDFGLARKLYAYGKYKKKKPDYLPWRWLSIESLRDLEFSPKSDIWAFGVTTWEIFTLAETPYHGLSYSLDFVDLIQQGLRLQKPKFASQEIYEDITLSCWSLSPKDRPSASQLKQLLIDRLEEILS